MTNYNFLRVLAPEGGPSSLSSKRPRMSFRLSQDTFHFSSSQNLDSNSIMTIDEAFQRVGGFGHFQALTLFLLALTRNLGMYQQYAFALLIKPNLFVCGGTSCTEEQMCSLNLPHQVDSGSPSFIHNWHSQLDLACRDAKQISSVNSFYFLGFGLGFFLFALPNQIGRKRTMTWLLPPYIVASALTLYSSSLHLKALGYFFQGALHLKITNSYTHMFELTPEKSKGFCATVMNAFDVMTVGIIGVCLTFVTNNMLLVLNAINFLESLAAIAYLVWVPESPKWLIENNRQEEAEAVFNRIAEINGSRNRIPENTGFDILGQAIQQNNTLRKTRIGELHAFENTSIASMTERIVLQANLDGTLQSVQSETPEPSSITRDLKKLLCDTSVSGVFWKSLLMFMTGINLNCLNNFQATHLGGNVSHLYIILGLGSAAGMVLSGAIVSKLKIPDWLIYVMALTAVFLCSLILDQRRDLALQLFFVQAFSVGSCLNLQFLIFSSRLNPCYISMGLEVCFCMSFLLASVSPILSSMGSTVMLITYCSLCSLGISVVHSLGFNKPFQLNVEEEIKSLIYESSQGFESEKEVISLLQKGVRLSRQISSRHKADTDVSNSTKYEALDDNYVTS